VGQILLADGQVAPGVRQLAGIVIKRFVADHWEPCSSVYHCDLRTLDC
jgi:hypothetical protein